MSVKKRMDEMLSMVEEAGSKGIERRELLKIFYEMWGFRLSTIKGYISDLEELEKIKIVGLIIYHSKFQPPMGLRRIIS